MEKKRTPLRQPRLAEMVAEKLRTRILSGELDDGDLLPRQEDLLDEFQVSKPSIREALRILETEGLITVQRGNVGGAVVHVPKAANAAYMLSLVLEAQRVDLADTAVALKHLESVCVGMCASRPDRLETVVPRLRELQAEAEKIEDSADNSTYTSHARLFHEELVAQCGNETMILIVGTLETLWSAHQQEWTVLAQADGEFPDAALHRRRSLDDHERIIEAIAAGDVEAAMHSAREHLKQSFFYSVTGDRDQRISTDALR